jgi:hypothetical protein
VQREVLVRREEEVRALNTLFVALLLLAAALQALALTHKTNIFDSMPIRCGHKLKDTCPSTGINWGKP